MKMRKRILPMVLAITMAGSLASFHVQAKDEDDTISLPVQLYDFDADGLFYEYALYNGMDTFGLGESNNEGVTQGLVNSTLGQNGLPVYTQQAVESAAKTIHENLLTQKSNEDVNKYSVFKNFANKAAPSGSSYETKDVLVGDNGNYFYNRWTLEGQTATGNSGELHTGVGTVWQQETDGVINTGVNDHLTNTFTVDVNRKYSFSYWKNNKELKYKIYDGENVNDAVLLDNVASGDANATFTSSTGKITIDIYREGNSNTIGKFSAVNLIDVSDSQDETKNQKNLLGNTDPNTGDGTTFISRGWKSSTYNSTIGKDSIVDGTTYWKQVGDGVACLSDSSIVMDTDIPANQYVNINYYLGYDGYNANGITIDLLDSNNKVLSHNTLKDETGGEYTLVADGTNGQGNIKVRINGKAGSRIAAIKLTPVGAVLPEGDYAETVQKYQDNQLKSVDDCKSCMDYAYLRLTNFFDTGFYKNKLSNKYTEMVLKSHEKEDGTIEYTFDSSKDITYKNGSFYNSGKEDASPGFFPLDDVGEEHLSDGNGGMHNYHFGMKVDGDFIYRKGANQFFDFSGDDDVYVFINGELAVDLGGAHKEVKAQLNIEDYAAKHNIQNGEKCKFQMFYLERHTTASNCKIETNLNIGNHAEYQFVSKTEGMNLPDEIVQKTPIDEDEYYNGQTVTNKEYNKKYKDVYDATNKGYWKFVGWDKESQKDDKSDIQFVGSWEFVKDDFKVDYNFVSGTKGKDLPDEIKKLLPANKEHLIKDDQVDVENNFNKEVKVSDGKWTFVSWDKESVTIVDKNESFTGTWVFTKDDTKPVNNNNNNQNKPNTPSNPTKGNRKTQKNAKVKTGVSITISFYLAMLISSLIGLVLLKKKLYK